MALGKIKIKIKTPTPTAAERLHAQQQKNRKAAGLPDPSEYKKKLDSMKSENYEEDDGPLSQEQLDEISSQLKASYVAGAKKQIKQSLPFTKKSDEYRDIAKNFIAKRQKGIAKASKVEEQLEKKGRFVSGPMKQPFKSNTILTSVKESTDEREYDYEGDMAKSDLRSIIHNAQTLHDMLDDNTNLAEWCQSKITLAEDYISTVTNYMRSEMNEEVKKNEYHIAGKHKFPTKDEHAVTVKHTESGREHVHSGKGKYLSKLIKTRYNINHYFEEVEQMDEKKNLPGLWANIHAKRKRGEPPAKPGDKDYPKTLNIESAAEPTEGEMKGKQQGVSRKAQIVMNAAKGKKSDSPDKFQKDPELSSEIHKT